MKIEVLIVDDAARKVERLSKLFGSLKLTGEVQAHLNVATAENVRDACGLLRESRFDLLILDMQLPFRAGDAPRPYGGARLIEALKDDVTLIVPAHIIGLTEYEELVAKFQSDLQRDLWFLLKYSESDIEWESSLARRIEHIATVKRNQTDVRYETQLAIVTALHQVELEAVLAAWPELSEFRIEGDDSIYHCGSIEVGGVTQSVVAVASTRMGMASAAALSMKVISEFRPRYMCMCGIAAGARGKADFGDILVATQSWDYGSGKATRVKGRSALEPAPDRVPIDEALKSQIEWFGIREKTVLQEIRSRWDSSLGDTPPSPPRILLGPLASGAAVVADPSVLDGLLAQDRKLLGLEMESYGLMLAARLARQPRPGVVVAKSVCDFGDAAKNDNFQPYAAYTSATFIRELFCRMLAGRAS